MKRDRFELLSAYLDGEVTPEERSLVQTWLNSDPTAKCLYNRLLALRQGLREESCVTSGDTEVTLARVFQCLNHRFRMVTMASAGVVVVGVLNLLSSGIGTGDGAWQMSQTSGVPALQIALDQPVFPIPDLPVAVPVEGTTPSERDGLWIDSEL
ncbi:MAG: transcriptional regulator [Leptolyngbyaceae cyanobacterium SM2_5_2]|nr:transcriptional regulator [Leptolyngbyaceae cyanobacterium SM2_5_2]